MNNNDERDNPKAISNEDLLRFLDSSPKVLRWPKNRELGENSPPPKSSGPECPAPESYTGLAAGKIQGQFADQLLAHAAVCDACSDVLAWNLSALEGNPSAEETAAIAELTARPNWQKQMARNLAATPMRMRPTARHPNWWAAAAIAAGLLLAAGLAVWKQKTNTPDHQLAMAYEQSRTMELRIPEADYSAMSPGGRTRGGLSEREPAPLLEATAQLARDLDKSPQNGRWLQLQARADVLEERYNSAIDVLDRLLAQGPVTADLLTDAAAAYYQRGLSGSVELDRSTALDYLRRADEMAPDDPVVLFNEAIVMEDRGQVMNAVEVWNRYLAVERDSKWEAEGKRKRAALEETLNRLKSHQSRVEKMLATPPAMNALAADPQRVAAIDEELSWYELDRLISQAYPEGNQAQNSQQARGSPCDANCAAARRLLKAIGSSLEIKHHDPWLTDLLSPDIDSLPAATAVTYSTALQLLTHAIQKHIAGVRVEGLEDAREALSLFQKLETEGDGAHLPALAAIVGQERSIVEEMYGEQRAVDFTACRAVAQQLRSQPELERNLARYPWIEAQAQVTEKICDDTPETRQAGRALAAEARRVTEINHYALLGARAQMMLMDDAHLAGDQEATERVTLATFHALEPLDVPAARIASTIGAVVLAELDSPRGYMAASAEHDEVLWVEAANNPLYAAISRMELARLEMRIGKMQDAEKQIEIARAEAHPPGLAKEYAPKFGEQYIFLARLMLERGDLTRAESYLDLATDGLDHNSDTWTLRTYASSRGQLDLAQGKLAQAESVLDADIRASEGRNVRGGDKSTVAEFAQQDHDLYAELAATWLAQGRPPESVLALWERFRMRSRGLPITQCQGGALDCELPRLRAAQLQLGHNLLIGQIVLLDRILLYRVDKEGVTWTQKPLRRQDVLDTAQTLERAVSSPYTSLATAEKLGERLTDALLPGLPASPALDSALLLEPDPMLQNLSWPVLPTPAGPLGLQYPLAEVRSILADTRLAGSGEPGGSGATKAMCKRPLVVGASMAAGNEPPLPEVLEEAVSVSRLLHSTQPLIGEQATADNVAKALGSATIFHFAGHAAQTGNGTELLLAAASPNDPSPWVNGVFLRQHPPHNCQLAVLSACSTGAREASWDHPLQDIVETLADLGVPEVVATRWQIDSQAAVPFMETFYQNLAQGRNVALALTSARRVQFSQSLYGNPYYWGAYYVTGRETAR